MEVKLTVLKSTVSNFKAFFSFKLKLIILHANLAMTINKWQCNNPLDPG
ncbi:MAG: hypothetical protein HCTETUND2_063 [Candidatus Hodgkinia cicadicola]|nr:MAG: hypothetical protein HCTETUND2_063 [Candidatus Hodgkinia cicadicola]